jgi:Recombination endonuclease VII
MPQAIGDLKVCCRKNCERGAQPVSNFTKLRSSPDGFCPICKSCQKREHLRKSGKLYAKKKRLRIYDLTLEEYDAILACQHYVCGCCGEVFSSDFKGGPSGDYPVIHHDHNTGKVIGIWHATCNTAEGYIKTAKRAWGLFNAMQENQFSALICAFQPPKPTCILFLIKAR